MQSLYTKDLFCTQFPPTNTYKVKPTARLLMLGSETLSFLAFLRQEWATCNWVYRLAGSLLHEPSTTSQYSQQLYGHYSLLLRPALIPFLDSVSPHLHTQTWTQSLPSIPPPSLDFKIKASPDWVGSINMYVLAFPASHCSCPLHTKARNSWTSHSEA